MLQMWIFTVSLIFLVTSVIFMAPIPSTPQSEEVMVQSISLILAPALRDRCGTHYLWSPFFCTEGSARRMMLKHIRPWRKYAALQCAFNEDQMLQHAP